jgi:hypothetical protein
MSDIAAYVCDGSGRILTSRLAIDRRGKTARAPDADDVVNTAPIRSPAFGVIAACAASAGAHAALVPEHLHHEPRLGLAFIAATALLVAVTAALISRPTDSRVAHAAALLLGALIAGYAVAVSTGIPWLMDEAEPVDLVALATKSVEALGLVLAVRLNTTTGGHRSLTHKEARL